MLFEGNPGVIGRDSGVNKGLKLKLGFDELKMSFVDSNNENEVWDDSVLGKIWPWHLFVSS